jgi:hypothetical protein
MLAKTASAGGYLVGRTRKGSLTGYGQSPDSRLAFTVRLNPSTKGTPGR